MRARANVIIAIVVLLGCVPFLNQAFHIDDATFLALAAHAWPHPLRLYDFSINWLGHEQRAFEVLANPPLVPWYLRIVAAFAGGREWVFHLAFLPFVLLAIVGIDRLGKRFAADPFWTVLFAITAPVFLLPSHTVMPDVALLAIFTLGTAIAIDGIDSASSERAFLGGLLAGASALCRYSGICVVPLLLGYAVLRRGQLRSCLAAILGSILPIAAWSAASLYVYGEIHWLALREFETRIITAEDLLFKLLYQVSTLTLAVGIAALLALLLSRSLTKWDALSAAVGLAAALVIAPSVGLRVPATVLLMIGMAGTAVLAATVLKRIFPLPKWGALDSRAYDDLFLFLWLLGVVLFNCRLMFASARYLILALPPTVLLLQRRFQHIAGQAALSAAVAITLTLSLFLSLADVQMANAYRSYISDLPRPAAQRWFVGHWGWQYYLEQSGALALSPDDRNRIHPADEIVSAVNPWPQVLPPQLRLDSVTHDKVDTAMPLRTCSLDAQGCFYSNWVAPLNSRVVLPYGLTRAPLEVFTRMKTR